MQCWCPCHIQRWNWACQSVFVGNISSCVESQPVHYGYLDLHQKNLRGKSKKPHVEFSDPGHGLGCGAGLLHHLWPIVMEPELPHPCPKHPPFCLCSTLPLHCTEQLIPALVTTGPDLMLAGRCRSSLQYHLFTSHCKYGTFVTTSVGAGASVCKVESY